MNTLQVNFPVAPPAAMPEPLQTIFFYITAVGVVGIFLFSLYMCRKHRSLAPLLMVIAAGAAIPLEPVVGFLGHVVHPAEGSIRMFEAVNRVIPYHMFFAYILGFGTVYLAFFNGIVERSITPKYAWTACAITVCSYILIEIYPVSKGLWVYYDPQPLWLWQGMAPLTWSFMNTACEIMGVALIYLAWPHLKGWRQLLIIPLAPRGGPKNLNSAISGFSV